MKHLFYFLLLSTTFVFAQSEKTTLSGIVTANGKPVPFVSIYIKGGSEGTSTDGDNYSELPELKGNSFGVNAFYLPTENSKLEMSISSLFEYRYGGEIVDKPAHL